MRKSNLIRDLSDINHKKTEGGSAQSPGQRQTRILRKAKAAVGWRYKAEKRVEDNLESRQGQSVWGLETT